MPWSAMGSNATIAPGKTAHWHYSPHDEQYVGPIVVAPNFATTDEPFQDISTPGELSAGNVSVRMTLGNASDPPGGVNPLSFEYFFSFSNAGATGVTYNAAIGTV